MVGEEESVGGQFMRYPSKLARKGREDIAVITHH